MEDRAHNGPTDRLLRRWAAARAPSPERLDRLKRRIVQNLLEAEPRPRNHCETPRRRRATRWLAGGLTIGLASAAALAIVFLRAPDNDDAVFSLSPGDPTQLARLDDEQLEAKAALLHEIERLFEGRLCWAAETDRAIELGLRESEGAADPDALAVRIVVARRPAAGYPWRRVWSVDVLTREEEVVRVPSHAMPQAGELSLWTHVLPDGMISLDGQLRLEDDHLNADLTGLQQPGTPAVLVRGSDRRGEFRILQTAVRLGRLG